MFQTIRRVLATLIAIVLVSTSCGTKNLTDEVDELRQQPVNLAVSAEVGSLPGAGNVDRFGQAQYAIPIDVSPGVRGMAPSLAVEYGSDGGNGYVGLGFGLAGFSSIERRTRTIAQDGAYAPVTFTSEDVLCYGGERLILASGLYGQAGSEYRTRRNPFAKIVLNDSMQKRESFFEVYTKSGEILSYGGGQASLLTADDVPFRWAVASVRDRFNNRIDYLWETIGGPAHLGLKPSRITYGGSPGVSPREVRFEYEPRDDVRSGYFFGHATLLDERLTGIIVEGTDDELLHTYTLTYIYHDDTGQSLLQSLRKCDAAGACLPATTFEWEERGRGAWFRAVEDPNGHLSEAVFQAVVNNARRTLVGDFDGDSQDDLLFWTPLPEHQEWWAWSSQQNDFDRAVIPLTDTTLPGGFGELERTVEDAIQAYAEAVTEALCGPPPHPIECEWAVDPKTVSLPFQGIFRAQPDFGISAINFNNNASEDLLIPLSPDPVGGNDRDDWGISYADSFLIGVDGGAVDGTEPFEFVFLEIDDGSPDPIYNVVPLDHDGDGLTDIWLCRGRGFKSSHWVLAHNDGDGSTVNPYGFTYHNSQVGCSIHDELQVASLHGGGRQSLLIVPAYQTDPLLMKFPEDFPDGPGAYLAGVDLIPEHLRDDYQELVFSPGSGPGQLQPTGLPRDLYQRWHDRDCHNSVAADQEGAPLLGAGIGHDKHIDINGDGFVDVLRFQLQSGDDPGNVTLISAGLGDEQWWLGVTCGSAVEATTQAEIRAYINTGDGFVDEGSIHEFEGNAHANLWLNFIGAQVHDWNHDGLADLVLPSDGDGGDWKLLRSNGDGTFEVLDFEIFTGACGELCDIPFPDSPRPIGWPQYTTNEDWKEQLEAFIRTRTFTLNTNYRTPPVIALVGDTDDWKHGPFVSWYNWDLSAAGGSPGVRLTRIIDGLGAAEKFSYDVVRPHAPPGESATGPGTNAGLAPRVAPRAPMVVVSSHAIQINADGDGYISHYAYRDVLADTYGRGMVGFGEIEVTQPGRVILTRYDQTYDAALADYPYTQTASSTQVVHNHVDAAEGGTERHVDCAEVESWDLRKINQPGGVTWFIYPNETRHYAHVDPTHDCGEQFPLIPWREVIGTEERDEYGTITLSTTNDGHEDVTVTAEQLINDEADWFIGRPQRITSQSCVSTSCKIREISFSYDPSTQSVDSRITEPNDPLRRLTATFQYSAHGNVRSTTVNGEGTTPRTTTINWDSEGVFPLDVTNAMEHTSYLVYHRASGALLATVDPNGFTTKTGYDGFFRTVNQKFHSSPLGPSDSGLVTHKFSASGALEETALQVVTKIGPLGQTITVDFGPTGRELRRAWRGVVPSQTFPVSKTLMADDVYVLTEYDDRGRMVRASRPTWAFEPIPSHWMKFEYDDRDRTLTTRLVDGANTQIFSEQTYAYRHRVPWDGGVAATRVDVVDPDGNSSFMLVDAQGRPRMVHDAEDFETCYSYGAFGAFEHVKRNCNAGATGLSSQTIYTYDQLGWRLSEMNPLDGFRTYTYTPFGELDTVKDPNGITKDFDYDLIGRVVRREDTDGSDVRGDDTDGSVLAITTWEWDTARIGALASSSSPDQVTRAFTYDAFGRLATDTTSVQVDFWPGPIKMNRDFTYAYTYGEGSRLETVKFPALTDEPGLTVEFHYDAAGYIRSVDIGTPTDPLWGLESADEFSQRTREHFPGQVSTERVYYPESFLPHRITVRNKEQTAFSQLEYQWSDAGDLESRQNILTSQLESFQYDGLHRLLRADIPPFVRTTVYDALGNITHKSNVGDYTYDPITGRLQSAGSISLGYDANGNINNRGNQIISYTSFDSVRAIHDGAHVTRFGYDAAANRVERVIDNTIRTVTIGGFYQRIEGTNGDLDKIRLKVPDGSGSIIAEIEHDKVGKDKWEMITRSIHDDYLGSGNTITSEGNIVAKVAYDPWGLAIEADDWTQSLDQTLLEDLPTGFTGHQPELDGGLINMRGRMYDPLLGRFMSIDPLVDGLFDGQSWNRYSYVNNRPLVYFDPSGFYRAAAGDGGGSEPAESGSMRCLGKRAGICIRIRLSGSSDPNGNYGVGVRPGNMTDLGFNRWVSSQGYSMLFNGVGQGTPKQARTNISIRGFRKLMKVPTTTERMIRDTKANADLAVKLTDLSVRAMSGDASAVVEGAMMTYKGVEDDVVVFGTALGSMATSDSIGEAVRHYHEAVPPAWRLWARVMGARAIFSKWRRLPPVGGSDRLFPNLSNNEIERAFGNLNLGPLVRAPAAGVTGSGPKLGGPGSRMWFHDNMRVKGVRGAPGGRPVNIRVHSEDPNFPRGYTLQINTQINNPSTQGPSFYRTPEGTWHLLEGASPQLMDRLHIPAGN